MASTSPTPPPMRWSPTRRSGSKTHFPAEFMAAVMTADMDNTDKIVTLVDECQRMGLTVIPPDVNTGRYRFSVNGTAISSTASAR